TIAHSHLDGNTIPGNGQLVDFDPSFTGPSLASGLTVTDSTFSNNHLGTDGGLGIEIDPCGSTSTGVTATFARDVFANNEIALTGSGAAAAFFFDTCTPGGAAQTVDVTDTTIRDNKVGDFSAQGGGILWDPGNPDAKLTITSSTIAGNRVGGPTAGLGDGG